MKVLNQPPHKGILSESEFSNREDALSDIGIVFDGYAFVSQRKETGWVAIPLFDVIYRDNSDFDQIVKACTDQLKKINK